MPDLTAENYLETGDRCLENGLYEAAIVAYGKALQIGTDPCRAEEALQNAYDKYEIPGLQLISRDDYIKQYPKRPQLPNNVAYILKGTKQLQKLPEFAKVSGESDMSHVDFELSRKYPIINDSGFAIDFSECSNLEDIPSTFFSMSENLICADLSGCDKLSKINDSAFAFCPSLESVIFPKNIKTIGGLAFQSAALKNIDLSNTKVESIQKLAFNYNQFLTEATLSDNLKEICEEAFLECYNLKELKNLTANLEKFPANSLKNTAIKEVHVPEGFLEFYLGGVKIKYSEIVELHNYATLSLRNYFEDKDEHGGIYSGHLNSAYLNLKKMFEIDPNHQRALLECGYVCLQLHKHEEAEEYFKRLIDLKCTDNEINYNAYIGHARANMPFEGKENEVIDDLSRAIEIANTYKQIDEKEHEAIKNLRWVKLKSSYAECYMQRSRMYERLGNKEEAEKDYKKAVEIDSSYKFPRFELIKAEDYHGAMKLPEDTKYVLKGSNRFDAFPCLGRICTLAENRKRRRAEDKGYFSRLNLEEMYPELLNNKFALDFSNCRRFGKFDGCTFAGSKNIVAADLSGCDELREIPGYCFEDCSNLETIIFNSKLQEIKSNAFTGCGLKNLDLSNITSSLVLEWEAFEANKSLEKVVFSESLDKIRSYCFKDCTSLCKVSPLPNKIYEIGRDVFKNTALKEVKTRRKDYKDRFPNVGIELKLILTDEEDAFLQGKERVGGLYDYEGSVKYFNEALKYNENYTPARILRGRALYEGFKDAEHLDLAVSDLTKVLEQKPDKDTTEKVHFWRALALIKKDELHGTDNKELIKSDLDQSVRVNFDCSTNDKFYEYNYVPMAKAYCRCGDYDSAAYVLENALKNPICSGDFDMTTELGIINIKKNDYNAAVKNLDKAEKLHSRYSDRYGFSDLYYYRGKAKSALCNPEEALQDYEKAAKYCSYVPVYRMNNELKNAISTAIKETKEKIENKREPITVGDLSGKTSRSTSRAGSRQRQNVIDKTK